MKINIVLIVIVANKLKEDIIVRNWKWKFLDGEHVIFFVRLSKRNFKVDLNKNAAAPDGRLLLAVIDMFSFEKIKEELSKEPAFRLKQALKAVYHDACSSWEEVTVLSKDMRKRLQERCPLEIAVTHQEASDGDTIKALFDFAGDKIESVLMRHDGRNTVCVSSQTACALGCKFCLTGTLGAGRDLQVDEIITQVLYFNRILKAENERVTNVVFMGMGEPFLNYNNVMEAIRKLNDSDWFGIGARKISVSTAGIIPGIEKFMQEDLQLNLSLSLHAPNDKLRSEIMPINRKYPLVELLPIIKKYISHTKRRVMIEYIMLAGVNDSEKQAEELAQVLKEELKELFFVNLIRYNETGKFKPSSTQVVNKFKKILEKNKIEVVERYRFGRDIKAACGQLASQK
jgi:23S rRNA (adenine2503-C2)-methyltransferase